MGVVLEPAPYDLFVQGGNGGRDGQLAIEVKSARSGRLDLPGATAWFDALRGAELGPQPWALAILDPWAVYLRLPAAFRNAATNPEPLRVQAAAADYVFASGPSLAAFIDTERLPLATLRHDDLLLVVSSWLSFVMSASVAQLLARPADAWVVETGLHRAIAGGTVQENDLRRVYGGHPLR